MKPEAWIVVAGMSGAAAVAAGAFGAHGPEGSIPDSRLSAYLTGADYHLVHSVALLLVGYHATTNTPRFGQWPAAFFAAGICLFSGSLYALALSGVSAFGAITPLGGVCFLLGWITVALSATPSKDSADTS